MKEDEENHICNQMENGNQEKNGERKRSGKSEESRNEAT